MAAPRPKKRPARPPVRKRRLPPGVRAGQNGVELRPDPNNLNRGTKRGLDLLEHSLEKYGAGRPIFAARDGTILGGNKTWLKAVEMGLPVEIVRTRGDRLIVHLREDLKPDSPEARALAFADNRVAQADLDWDPEQMARAIEDGVPIHDFTFPDELSKMLREPQSRGTLPKTKHVEFDAAEQGERELRCPRCNEVFKAKETLAP